MRSARPSLALNCTHLTVHSPSPLQHGYMTWFRREWVMWRWWKARWVLAPHDAATSSFQRVAVAACWVVVASAGTCLGC